MATLSLNQTMLRDGLHDTKIIHSLLVRGSVMSLVTRANHKKTLKANSFGHSEYVSSIYYANIIIYYTKSHS